MSSKEEKSYRGISDDIRPHHPKNVIFAKI
jgi:hypothetical protein